MLRLWLAALMLLPSLGFASVRDFAPPPTTKILFAVPLVEQTTNYTCGPAAMQAVLAYYGHTHSEMELAAEMGTTEKAGTDHHRMAAFANKLGVKAVVKHNLSVADLAAAIARDQLAIVEAQAWGTPEQVAQKYQGVWDAGHYMVVIGIDDKHIYFVDPSAEKRRGYIALAEFENRWRDLGWNNEPLHRTAILFEGRPDPPPAPTGGEWIAVP